jgi:esterase
MSSLLAHDRITAPDATPDRWMLVLHGIYGAGRNWASVARRLVRARPEWGAILVDLRLHGDSRDFAPPHTLEACADDVKRLVAETGVNAEAILGHSFGGKVALIYARDSGETRGEAGPVAPPRSVWVVDSTPSARAPDGSAWTMLEVLRRAPGPFADRAEGIAAVESAGFPNPVAQWMATNLVPSSVGDELVWRLDPDDMEALMRDFFETDAWPVIESPKEETRVHVIKARESSVLDAEAVEQVEAAARTTDGRVALHHVKGGHWVNADDPDGLIDLLVEHLP